jgi:hypothetical protein
VNKNTNAMYVLWAAITITTRALPALASDLQHAQENGRTIEWGETAASDGATGFRIQYAPYFNQIHSGWAQLRFAKAGQDPMGDRAYWTPVSGQDSGQFDFDLDPKSAAGWAQVEQTIDNDVLSVVFPDLAKFVAKNKASLQITADSIVADLSSKGITMTTSESSGSVMIQFNNTQGNSVFNDETMSYLALQDFINPRPHQTLATQLELAQEYQSKLKNLVARTPIHKVPVAPALPDKPVLIVTHATEKWDFSSAAEANINEAISQFKGLSDPVVFLMDDDGVNDKEWYTKDRSPTFALYSSSGEHDIPVLSSDVTVVGGYFGRCQTIATTDAISRYFRNQASPLQIHFPMNAIYIQDNQPDGQTNENQIRKTIRLADVKSQVELLEKNGNDEARAYIDKHFSGSPAVSDDPFLGFLNSTLFMDADGGNRGPLAQLGQAGPVSGKVDFQNFQFKVFVDGSQKEVLGVGSKVVELRFE